MSDSAPASPRRSDAVRNRGRILDAAERLLQQSPAATLADIAAVAGVSRSTVHRHFADRDRLVAAVAGRPRASSPGEAHDALPAGHLGRGRSVVLDAIHVFDVVPPALLPEQLVAEAQRIAGVPVALYVLDIDGSHLLRIAGPQRLPDQIASPLAVGPELDGDGPVGPPPVPEPAPGLADLPAVAAGPRDRRDDRVRPAPAAADARWPARRQPP